MNNIEAMTKAAALGLSRPTLTRVKMFAWAKSWDLEEAINKWIKEQPPGFHLVDIRYQIDETLNSAAHFALVIYTIPEPLEDIFKEAET